MCGSRLCVYAHIAFQGEKKRKEKKKFVQNEQALPSNIMSVCMLSNT